MPHKKRKESSDGFYKGSDRDTGDTQACNCGAPDCTCKGGASICTCPGLTYAGTSVCTGASAGVSPYGGGCSCSVGCTCHFRYGAPCTCPYPNSAHAPALIAANTTNFDPRFYFFNKAGLLTPTPDSPCQICGVPVGYAYRYRNKLGQTGHEACVVGVEAATEGCVRLSDLLVDPSTTPEWAARKQEWLDAWKVAWEDYRAAGEERPRSAPAPIVAASPVVGVRAFTTTTPYRKGGLGAIYASYEWLPGENRAGCIAGGYGYLNRAPQEEPGHDLTKCQCGYHAYHPEYVSNKSSWVSQTCAVVVGYGKVAIHGDEGWRAEYARIVGILDSTPRAAKQARYYGVPVVAPAALMAFAAEHGVSAAPRRYVILGEAGCTDGPLPVADVLNATQAEVEGALLAQAVVVEYKAGLRHGKMLLEEHMAREDHMLNSSYILGTSIT